jgi:hypothetical protein
MTTLRDLVADLDALDGELTIYADGGVNATASSSAVAALEPEDGTLPPEATGLEYVLEVDLAREAVGVWREWRDGREPSVDDKVRALLHYAKYDDYLPV